MENTTVNEVVTKGVNDVLRQIDLYIKNGELAKALREIDRASKMDPGNMYVRAYQERIFELRKSSMGKSVPDPMPAKTLPVKERSMEEYRPKPEDDPRMVEEIRKSVEDQMKTELERQKAGSARKLETEQRMQAEQRKKYEEEMLRQRKAFEEEEQKRLEELKRLQEECQRMEEQLNQQKELDRKSTRLNSSH